MGTSMIDLQRSILLQTIRETAGRDEWKVLVLDENSKRLVDNVAKEDDILNENVTNIEQIEQRRQNNSSTDAVYLLSPLPHIVECLKADLRKRRYRRTFLIWTSPLSRSLDENLKSQAPPGQIVNSRSLNIDFFPRESHLVITQEPWSFQNLYHPACDDEIQRHFDSLTRKIVSICVSLGEYPLVKYYRPRNQDYRASSLCSHLANFVQKDLDLYAQRHPDFPPPSNRPQGVLIITDRTMDLMSPLVHEFTYQAMAMDLLPLRDDEVKLLYRNTIKKGTPEQEEKDVEINENDKIWVANRHMHMKDLLGKIVDDFNKFRADNPQFADDNSGKTSVNDIKDMLAGLPQFQEGKEAFSLHLEMAEKCVNIFQNHKLPDIASVEQSLATGLDEEFRKPKNLADQLARLLDDDSVVHEDRLRLLIMYILFRNGLLNGDIEKLRQHAQLSEIDREIIYNLQHLGGRMHKSLKDAVPPPQPLFSPKVPTTPQAEEVSLSRFEPAMRYMLEEQCLRTLDSSVFPLVNPGLEDTSSQATVTQTSLRSANKPTWARTRPTSHEPRQRIIIFMAGGATYSEARACYEVSQNMSKEVFLATSHMLTPKTFLRQLSMLSRGKDQLDHPANRPRPRVPAWVTEADAPPRPPVQQPSIAQQPVHGRPPENLPPPTEAMRNMNLGAKYSNGSSASAPSGGDRLKKEKKEKKHLGLFRKH
jgi:syntaxin-binding protein 1